MGMGGLNFIMALTACIFLVRPANLTSAGYLFLFLCFYAMLFLTIPAIRLLYTFEKNRLIKRKNQRVHEFENRLGNPSPELAHRLEEAEEMRALLTVTGDSPIVYSTKADYLEQISDNDFQRDLKLGGA